jgi:ribosomal protein L7/L12
VDEQQAAFSDKVLAAVDRGRKIQAIKIYRADTGVDLKDAKDVIDALFIARQKDPQIAAGMVEEGGAGSLIKMIVTVAVIFGVYFYFFAS